MPSPPTSVATVRRIKSGVPRRVEVRVHSLRRNSTDGSDPCHNIRYDRLRINRIRRLRIRRRRHLGRCHSRGRRMRLLRLMDGRENNRVGFLEVEDRLLVLHLYVDHESMRDILVRMVDLSLLFLDLLGLAAVICGREVSALIKRKRTIPFD